MSQVNRDLLDSSVELLLDLELDGAATPTERELLAAGQGPELLACRVELERLHVALRRSVAEVRPGFRDQVLASLEPAGWEARHARGWRAPVAAMVVFGGLAAVLLGRGVAENSVAWGLFAALRDFVLAVAVAGGGFATASWRGLNVTLTDLVGGSLETRVALLIVALALNAGVFLWVRNVRRRARQQATSRARS